MLFFVFKITNAQVGQCLSGGCYNFGNEYPSTNTPYNASTSWALVNGGNNMNAGNWTRFNVTDGTTYECSYCETHGGKSIAWYAQMTLFNENNPSTDLCGNNNNAPYISWIASFTGIVRVLTMEYNGGSCKSDLGSPFNKLVFRKIGHSTPMAVEASVVYNKS